jgi:hypothetical protein
LPCGAPARVRGNSRIYHPLTRTPSGWSRTVRCQPCPLFLPSFVSLFVSPGQSKLSSSARTQCMPDTCGGSHHSGPKPSQDIIKREALQLWRLISLPRPCNQWALTNTIRHAFCFPVRPSISLGKSTGPRALKICRHALCENYGLDFSQSRDSCVAGRC